MNDKTIKRLTKEFIKRDDVLVIYLDGDTYILGIIMRDADWKAKVDEINRDRDSKLEKFTFNAPERDPIIQAARDQISETKGRLTVTPGWEIGDNYKKCKQWLEGFSAGIGYGSPDNLLMALIYRGGETEKETPPQNLVDWVNAQQGISYL